jgi:hypothetical protein
LGTNFGSRGSANSRWLRFRSPTNERPPQRYGYALANDGHDTRRIQDWLGHRSIQHTVRYSERDTVQRFLVLIIAGFQSVEHGVARPTGAGPGNPPPTSHRLSTVSL